MQPYIGEIRMFGGNFAPVGWLLCQGQLLPISQYQALFNLIQTTYGGDGQTTFALPDLRGRMPMHAGTGYPLGQPGGAETVALTLAQVPGHSHPAVASGQTAGSQGSPSQASWVGDSNEKPYNTSANNVMAGTNIGMNPLGGNLPHNNIPPYLAINYIISLSGVYPSAT